MKRIVSLLICLVLVLSLLPISAGANTIDWKDQYTGEYPEAGDSISTEPTVVHTTGTNKSEGDRSGNNWLLVLMVGLVSFGAAITAGVIILKKKRGDRS